MYQARVVKLAVCDRDGGQTAGLTVKALRLGDIELSRYNFRDHEPTIPKRDHANVARAH